MNMLVSRRSLLAGGAVLALVSHGIPALGSAAAPPRIETLADRLRLHFGRLVTEVRIPVAGVASVVSCPPERIATGGGFFADPEGPAPEARTEVLGRTVRLIASGIIVEADKATGRLRFLDEQGRERVREAGEPPAMSGVTGLRRSAFTIGADEPLHGLGQFREPVFDYRNQDEFLAQANSDAVNPFLNGGRWGLLWDTGTVAHFRSRGQQVEFHSIAGDLIRYHVCVGETGDEVIARYRALTGGAQLLPKWAYGFWQSKERYGSAAEVTGVVDEYQRRKLPIDAVVLDWRYWGENDRFSGMIFDPKTFPDPKGMVDHVHAANVHLLASIWPAFGWNTPIYKEMEAGGHLFPGKHWSGGRVFDASSPQARDIYWKHVKSGVVDTGMDGLWTDGSEPEFLATADRYGTTASYVANGNEAAGPIAENALTFSWYQAKGLSEAWTRDLPEKRPVILTRSVYAGQQKFGAITWSGDIFSSWGTLTNQVIAAQNIAASGIPHWTDDIGAFLVFHRYPDGLDDPAFKELYVRWFQFGAFHPIFRAHGTHVPRELWRFGEPGSPFYDALEKALRLRYALTLYVYSQAAAVAERGASFVRPLALAFPQDAAARDKPMSYMFGDDLLVTVVDRPFEHASANIQEFLPSRAIRSRNAPAARLEYFEGYAFGKKVGERLTDDIKVSWPGDLPVALGGKPYSVRYTGVIVAQEDGPHEFIVMGKGAICLWFDGKLVVEESGTRAAADGANGAVSFKEHTGDARHSFTVKLAKGQAYDFRLEQRQNVPDVVSLWFEWITPSQRQKMRLPERKEVATYLPSGENWYDFESGQRHAGGQTVASPAKLDHMPIFVRSGAILPLTPGRMRAQAPLTQMQLRVYPGRDGALQIYDDAGDGQGHLAGEKARIPVSWDDKQRVLTIGARKGSFPGMPETIQITASVVGGTADSVLPYVGREIRFAL